ncbi:MAG: deoxyguanosinetriphosphate triphosphohydrolase [Oscillospiraceae bacterium]
MNWKQLLSAERSRSAAADSNDIRTEFRRDYHRILNSASFRRLQDKTQVFPLDRGDFVRTRLTHSLEVSSFAESLADTAFTKLIKSGADPEITTQVRENCCDILRCAGLVHDIGNPPFGHFGEFTIREWFKDNLPGLEYRARSVDAMLSEQMKGDFLNFEGNAQALRVLTKLHLLIDEHGMNLTFALLNTIIKYPVASTGIDKHSGNIKDKKMGYYLSEQPLFERITESTGAAGCRYPLTFLLEAADDIAYKTADIEDAVRKGMLSYQSLLAELSGRQAQEKCRTVAEREALKTAAEKLEHCLESAQKRAMPSPEENAVQNWIVRIQSYLLYSAADEFVLNYNEIMRGEYRSELLGTAPVRVLAEMLSDIAYRYAFTSKEIFKIELSVKVMLDSLLERLTGAALRINTPQQKITDEKMISVISENYLRICEMSASGGDEAQQAYARLQLVTDYVCGMTDGYARSLYRDITGIT